MNERSQSRAFLSFHTGVRETLLFWLDETLQEPRVDSVAVSAGEIADAAQKLRHFFSKINYRRPEKRTDMAWLAPLGDALLAPLTDRLGSPRDLVVCPHGELHALPVHMLPRGGSAPLGVTHAVSYAPSLSFHSSHQSRPEPHARGTSFFGAATAAFEDSGEVHDSFVTAPRAFAQATGGTLEVGIEASIAAVRQAAPATSILYLSCHGIFDAEQPLESFLLLSDGETLPSRYTRDHDGMHRLLVRDIIERRIAAPLVILDACLSGVQQISPGDEPMGFPTAFLLAGASAVIATNWVVEQNRARDFMLALIDHWSSGSVPLGRAVQSAYTSVRGQYPHPFHWAAFSLFGNSRLTFARA